MENSRIVSIICYHSVTQKLMTAMTDYVSQSRGLAAPSWAALLLPSCCLGLLTRLRSAGG